MSTLLDRTPDRDAELIAMRRLLDYGQGSFSSAVAVCNSPVERDRIITDVRGTHPDVVVVSIPARTIDVYGYVREQVPQSIHALFVVNLEASIASQVADSHTLRSLNASRDLWPMHYHCPVVLWLPEYATTALSQQARDYWRFISHRFYFAKESGLVIPRSIDVFSGEYLNAINLSHEEKLSRIQELEGRLASLGQPVD